MMRSVVSIYKIGVGPSSSHSMGPRKAAEMFKTKLPEGADAVTVRLYGSLAATGKGHLTDKAISAVLPGMELEFEWKPEEYLPEHENAMVFEAYRDGESVCSWTVYSIGGGEITDGPRRGIDTQEQIYPTESISEIVADCEAKGMGLMEFIYQQELDGFMEGLETVWGAMKAAVERGLGTDGILPGPLKLKRRARGVFDSTNHHIGTVRDMNLISAYALAVSEENAAGAEIVTAPTCGACGVLPGILYFLYTNCHRTEKDILEALAIAGLFGMSVARRASISGAEVGCQGEVGTACAMASAATGYLLGGTNKQIEYAAEMGLEHFLGLTCDPVKGYVQIPCIERNAFGAMRALQCASYAVSTDGEHVVSFDDVVSVMNETGKDLQKQYRETSLGGLARIFEDRF